MNRRQLLLGSAGALASTAIGKTFTNGCYTKADCEARGMIKLSRSIAQDVLDIVAFECLHMIMSEMPLAHFVTRDWSDVEVKAPTSVDCPHRDLLSSTSITLDQHLESTFCIPNVMHVLASQSIPRTYCGPAAFAIAERLEGKILALRPKAVLSGSLWTPTWESTIDAIEAHLYARNEYPIAPSLWLSPSDYKDLRQCPGFSETTTGAKLMSLFVHRSQLLNPGEGLAFDRGAIGLATRPSKLPANAPKTGYLRKHVSNGVFGITVTMSYNPETLGQQFSIECTAGVGLLDDSLAIRIGA